MRTTGTGREMLCSVGQMTELVGRVPLKDIVRDTTDLIERLCIEAALELTHDNRASAAEMLGLSRQSLYVKLRRFNIGDFTPVSGDDRQVDDILKRATERAVWYRGFGVPLFVAGMIRTAMCSSSPSSPT